MTNEAFNSDIRAWGRKTLKGMRRATVTLDAWGEGDLNESLKIRYGTDFGRIERISIEHIYYGLFVRLGVGRGDSAEQARLGRGSRIPKDFAAWTLDGQHMMEELGDIVARHYADMSAKLIDYGKHDGGTLRKAGVVL